MYLNTLYDFPFLELHGKFVEANADIIDVNGKLAAFKNDNGMPNIRPMLVVNVFLVKDSLQFGAGGRSSLFIIPLL